MPAMTPALAIDRILDGVTAHEAAQQRDLMINETKHPPELTKKVRVGNSRNRG